MYRTGGDKIPRSDRSPFDCQKRQLLPDILHLGAPRLKPLCLADDEGTRASDNAGIAPSVARARRLEQRTKQPWQSERPRIVRAFGKNGDSFHWSFHGGTYFSGRGHLQIATPLWCFPVLVLSLSVWFPCPLVVCGRLTRVCTLVCVRACVYVCLCMCVYLYMCG
jgi:hypothetical protein